VAPDAVCVLDTNAFTPRTGAWLHDAASSLAPPPFESLYSIHCVGDSESAPCWLHTHGLERCGSIELDLVDVPADFAGLAAQLLNVVSAMFIETGVPEPDEPFLAGHELELVWLPWESGVKKVSRALPGSADDRDEVIHAGARGILFAPLKGMLGRKYASVSQYREILEGHPLLYLSNMATTRATLLAKERMPRFLALFERFGGRRDDWLFLMKLGYRVAGGEHLWFEVHAVEVDQIDATLLNQPHAITSMHEGQRASHALNLLSDWAIMCTHGRFEPDSVGELERYLAEVD
jgi:hypothetical protein